MKNKEWYKNITEHGILCKHNKTGQFILIEKYKNNVLIEKDSFGKWFGVDEVRPITPEEWWSFAPWNYDMDSADKSGKNILLKDESENVDTAAWGIDTWWSNTTGSRFYNPIAWLPLPENK